MCGAAGTRTAETLFARKLQSSGILALATAATETIGDRPPMADGRRSGLKVRQRYPATSDRRCDALASQNFEHRLSAREYAAYVESIDTGFEIQRSRSSSVQPPLAANI